MGPGNVMVHALPCHDEVQVNVEPERKRRCLSNARSLDGDDVCPICHDVYGTDAFPVLFAPCGHLACQKCTLLLQQKGFVRTCPLCRAAIVSVAMCPVLARLLLCNDGIPAPPLPL